MVMAFGAIYELSAEQRYAELNTFMKKLIFEALQLIHTHSNATRIRYKK